MNLSDKLRIGGVRVGRICLNISILATILTLFTAFSPLLMALYILCLVILIMITLGTIFVLVDDFGSFFSNSTEYMARFTESAPKVMPILAAIAIVAAVVAIVFYSLDVRNKKHGVAITLSVLIIVITAVLFVLTKVVKL